MASCNNSHDSFLDDDFYTGSHERFRIKRPWKMSFRKLPLQMKAKLEQYGPVPIKIASVRDIPLGQIKGGLLRPIGIYYDQDDVLQIPTEGVVPSPKSGIWARRNLEGWEIVRRDLPKKDKCFSFVVPNFGDWSKGSHIITQTRECFQREVIGPLCARIDISLTGDSEHDGVLTVSFEENYVFDPTEVDFEKQLLLGINLLQEVAGCSDIFPANASRDQILKTRVVNWEIFPPGTSTKTIARSILRGNPSASPDVISNRLETIKKFGPIEFIRGTNLGTTAYFGAKFTDNLVVFENVRYGNAIYVMFENWEELSKRSRTELLRNPFEYERIVHRKGWEKRLKHVLNASGNTNKPTNK